MSSMTGTTASTWSEPALHPHHRHPHMDTGKRLGGDTKPEFTGEPHPSKGFLVAGDRVRPGPMALRPCLFCPQLCEADEGV